MPSSPPLKILNNIYSGSGNRFWVTPHLPEQISLLCASYGLDGIIVYHETSEKVDVRIFNCDGSEAAMCGNGLRCLIAHLYKNANSSGDFCITRPLHTKGGIFRGYYAEGKVTLLSPPPSPITLRHIEGFSFYCLSTGVPHAVSLDSPADFSSFGAHFVHHPAFGPEGSNITGVNPLTRKIQTFERGVYAITGACGTGCLAAAVVLASLSHSPPFTFHVPSGEYLSVALSPFSLTGEVTLTS